MKWIKFAGVVCAAGLVAACGDDGAGDASGSTDGDGNGASETTAATVDELTIEGAWIRPTPEVATSAAVYMTVQSPVDDELIGVEVDSEVAGAASMHETVTRDAGDAGGETSEPGGDEHGHHDHEDHGHDGDDHGGHGDPEQSDETASTDGDLTTMEPRSAIELPADEEVELTPGGLHLMLEELVEPLEAGDTVDLELEFQEADVEELTVDVLDTPPDTE